MSKRHQHRIVTEPYEPLRELQRYGEVVSVPIALEASVRGVSVENLNQVLVDTMTLRRYVQKSTTGRSSGPTFLPAPPALRQALRRTERAGGLHRGSEFSRSAA